MKNPTHAVSSTGKPAQLFCGVRFHLTKKGYYRCNSRKSVCGERVLHRAVWAFNKGPIPKGYVVHHRNECKDNNSGSNLRLLEKEIHDAHHIIEITTSKWCVVCDKLFRANQKALYCSVRCTMEARRRRRGAKKQITSILGQQKRILKEPLQKFFCLVCNKECEARVPAGCSKKRYCSPKCKSVAKRRRKKSIEKLDSLERV